MLSPRSTHEFMRHGLINGCDEMRCSCGNLLARLVVGGVELKCRRCKRTVVLPLGGNAAPEVNSSSA